MSGPINFFGVPLEDLDEQTEGLRSPWSLGETAPKDGTLILGWYAGWDAPEILRFWKGRWRVNDYNSRLDPPDFWMPIPKSPFKDV